MLWYKTCINILKKIRTYFNPDFEWKIMLVHSLKKKKGERTPVQSPQIIDIK
jgi:hypothetical protein